MSNDDTTLLKLLNSSKDTTLRPLSVGSVMRRPQGTYTRSFCSTMNFATFRRHWKIQMVS